MAAVHATSPAQQAVTRAKMTVYTVRRTLDIMCATVWDCRLLTLKYIAF